MLEETTIIEIKNKILARGTKITPIAYYSYPTGTVGTSYIASERRVEENYSTEVNLVNDDVVNIVDIQLNKALNMLGFTRDNKEAVMCEVEGLDFPVYFVSYDLDRIICKEINKSRGGIEFLLNNQTNVK